MYTFEFKKSNMSNGQDLKEDNHFFFFWYELCLFEICYFAKIENFLLKIV